MGFIFVVIISLLFIWFITFIIQNKIKIKIRTFFKRGFSPKRGDFGVYCYHGKQGKGKTYSIVEYLLDHKKNIVVYCNVADIKNLNYTWFVGFKGLIDIKEKIDNGEIVVPKGKQLVIVYDEIFTELMKGDKLSKPVLDFLCQMRKRKIIFLTTAQEWAEIPISFRRFCRYAIKCNMINFFGIGLLFKVFEDAENMKWDDTQQEFIAPLCETTLTKCRREIADSYDTFLRISSVAPTNATEEKLSND